MWLWVQFDSLKNELHELFQGTVFLNSAHCKIEYPESPYIQIPFVSADRLIHFRFGVWLQAKDL